MRGRAAGGGRYRGCRDEKTCSNLSLTPGPPALSRIDYCCRCRGCKSAHVSRTAPLAPSSRPRVWRPGFSLGHGRLSWPFPTRHTCSCCPFSASFPQGGLDTVIASEQYGMDDRAKLAKLAPSSHQGAARGGDKEAKQERVRQTCSDEGDLASQMSKSPRCDESRTSPRQLRKLAQTTAAAAAEVLP